MTIQTTTRNVTRSVPEHGVGERLRVARIIRGLSQAKMGDICGLTLKIIGNIERGTTQIDGLQLYGWAEICGVNRDWIRTGKGNPLIEPPEPDGGIPNNVHPISRQLSESKDCQSLARLSKKAFIWQPIAARHEPLSLSGNGYDQTCNLKAAA